MPDVSAQEARSTICNLKKDGLFADSCQEKFNAVGQDDAEKIADLFTLLGKIKNDKNISDYDRMLLAQVVFAALPAQDSPTTQNSSSVFLGWLKNLIKNGNTVYAQEQIMSEEEFKALMASDLQKISDNVPKGDNAWVINVMISRYSWVDDKSRPYYSTQYMESSDPFPNNPNLNPQDITYHVQSRVGSKMSGQTIVAGSNGTSEMIAYSFSIVSWQSPKYETANGPVEEKFITKRRNRSHPSYYGLGHGIDYMEELLNSVKLPHAKLPSENSGQIESEIGEQSGEPKKITCEEFKTIIQTEKCKYFVRMAPIESLDDHNTIRCTNDSAKVVGDEYKKLPISYTYETGEDQCFSDAATTESERRKR